MARSNDISQKEILLAYKAVAENKGAAGVDKQSLQDFEQKKDDNLYKIWNRMTSGSYFPPAVREVEIPKEKGVRKLGIPTVADRVAQMVVKKRIESDIDKIFHEDSYGYRPNKSALDAVGKARERCWRKDWVLDLDIQGFFDNIDHELLMLAVKRHIDEAWILLYIERWLKAPLEAKTGEIKERIKGTPQGGVISPLLANLYLHYVFDEWMEINFPEIAFERYADDIVCHCKSLNQAVKLQQEIEKRLDKWKLRLNRDKTRIVYCKDSRRKGKYPNIKFDFLGYEFRPRQSKSKDGRIFMGFNPAASPNSIKKMYQAIKKWKIHLKSDVSIEYLAKMINQTVRGWFNYYGKYRRSELSRIQDYINTKLVSWARRKYRSLSGKLKAFQWIKQTSRRRPGLCVHWSRMTG